MPSQNIWILDETVGYHDTFCLVNMKESTEYYVHAHIPSFTPLPIFQADEEEIQSKLNERKSGVLEVNISHEASKWIA